MGHRLLRFTEERTYLGPNALAWVPESYYVAQRIESLPFENSDVGLDVLFPGSIMVCATLLGMQGSARQASKKRKMRLGVH